MTSRGDKENSVHSLLSSSPLQEHWPADTLVQPARIYNVAEHSQAAAVLGLASQCTLGQIGSNPAGDAYTQPAAAEASVAVELLRRAQWRRGRHPAVVVTYCSAAPHTCWALHCTLPERTPPRAQRTLGHSATRLRCMRELVAPASVGRATELFGIPSQQ
jgi:hypothetical protein